MQTAGHARKAVLGVRNRGRIGVRGSGFDEGFLFFVKGRSMAGLDTNPYPVSTVPASEGRPSDSTPLPRSVPREISAPFAQWSLVPSWASCAVETG